MNNGKWILAILVLGIAGLITSLYQRKSFRPRIVGGHQVHISSVPYLLALHVKQNNQYICGATIIATSWGISAFHCLKPDRMLAQYYYVRAGSSRYMTGGSRHELLKLYWYSTELHWVMAIPKYDIIIFKVTPNFRFSNKIKPAKLPDVGITPPEWLLVSGWGQTNAVSKVDNTSMVVHAANLSKVEWQVCIRVDYRYRQMVMRDRNLCYGKGNGTADTCRGDSGGPLADSETIYRIVSYGMGCAFAPGVYTDVSYYRQWINEFVNL